MMTWLKNLWVKWSETGVRVPFVMSGTQKKPSITLTFAYLTFAIACASITALHFSASLAIATWTSIGFWVIATVLYMMRSISKAKFDLDDKSIDLESGEKPEQDDDEPTT